jgi:hypothetical protein
MQTTKVVSGASRFAWKFFSSGWIGIVALTVLVWCIPLLPFKAALLFGLGFSTDDISATGFSHCWME